MDFVDVAADRQSATADHNRRETKLYAESLQRRALKVSHQADAHGF
jgi:hypothetical protein